MKHSQILKRAWKILWSYKALWIFGIILALTTASSFNNNFNWSENRNQPEPRQMDFDPDMPFWPQMWEEMGKGWEEAREEIARMLEVDNPDRLERNLIIAAVVFFSVIVALGLIGVVLRYIAETALIKMVDHFEETAEKLKMRAGWRLGWSRQAWRIFLVDLVIFIPSFIFAAIAFGSAILPIISFSYGRPASGVLSLVTSIGLILLFILFALVLGALVSLIKPVVFRKIVLEDEGVFAGIKAGWQMFRKAWKEYGLMWLILLGIDLVWPLAMLPFFLVAGALGLLLGGGVTFLTGGRLIEAGDPSMVWSIVLGGILFLVVLIVPLAFLGGLKTTFQSTSWTLAYRELKAEGVLANGNGGELLLPEDEAGGDEPE